MSRLAALAIPWACATLVSVAWAGPPTARFEEPSLSPPEPRPAPAVAPLESPVLRPTKTLAPARESWATRAARDLVERGERARAGGNAGEALRLYTEAVRMDPSYGPAYLALGHLRQAMGDAGEAGRVFDLAIRLPSGGADALAARAALRYARGDVGGAIADMEASLARDPHRVERLRQLGYWHIATHSWAGALSAWRRLLGEHERLGQSQELAQDRTQVRALTVLAAEADPVHGMGQSHPSWVRRALARISLRLPDAQSASGL
ncbi:MAG: hypothetical protein R3B13_41040 [Polyangiaceae bacterium]